MQSKRATYITICVLVCILLLAAWATWRNSIHNEAEFANPTDTFTQVAAAVTFTDLNGGRVTLEQFEGKVIVVNTWASWCPFCVQELPDFARLAREYSDENVVVMAVNRSEARTTVRDYLATLNTIDDIIFLLDDRDAYYKFIGGFTMPETLFYTTDGTVSFHKRGFMTLEEMRTHVEDAISASGG